MRRAGLLLIALITVLSAGCRTATPPAEPPAEVAAADETSELPLEVHWARNSAEHRAVYLQAYRLAGERLEHKVTDLAPGTWAVALDADETVVDNSLYQKELHLAGEDFTQESWAAWVARREAPPLPGVLAFLARVRELGGRIAIVTNRKQPLCEDTEENFRAFSIPFDVILCQLPEEKRKEARWGRVEDGSASPDLSPLTIVMWIGDNIHDFPHLDQDHRHGDHEALERFGVDFIVMPNAMYGSWVGNPHD